MKETLVVTETRTNAWLIVAASGVLSAVFGNAAASHDDLVFRILFSVITALSVASLVVSIWRLLVPMRLATFTIDGVIDAYEQEFPWHQIERIWMLKGCLMVKHQESPKWTVRLDPTQTGRKTLQQARTFIKKHAPPTLTGNI